MSSFYTRFFKVLVLLIGVSFSADCATLFDYGFQRPARKTVVAAPAKVESFDWGYNPLSGNTVIRSTAGEIVATIFSLQFGADKGKIAAYLNITESKKVEGRGFTDRLSAKKWVVDQAHTHGITLARELRVKK